MKKIILILASVVVGSGGAGWWAARVTIERRAEAAAQRAQAEQQVREQAFRARLAELVASADQITVESAEGGKKAGHRSPAVLVKNAEWQQDFARGLAAASYVRTPLPLGIFPPLVHVYREGREVLFYQGPGLISCGEEGADGIFQMDRATAAEIARRLLDKLPDSG